MNISPGQSLLKWWARLAPWPFGPRVFAWVLGRNVPYSGTIGVRVLEFRPGYVKLKLPDRRRVRNHLNSIHAIALVNFGELCTGMALLSQMPDHVRGIVIHIGVDYIKKARGDQYAQCDMKFPNVQQDLEHVVSVDIKDREGDIVATVSVTWRLGLKQ